jgi:hypothetical protein
MIRTMQDLLNAGVNAFGFRLIAKDVVKLAEEAGEPVHIPFALSGEKTAWITISAEAPEEAKQTEWRARPPVTTGT